MILVVAMVVVGKVVVPVVNGSVIYFVCENAVVKDSVVVIGADVVSVAVCDVVVLGEEVVIGADVVSDEVVGSDTELMVAVSDASVDGELPAVKY